MKILSIKILSSVLAFSLVAVLMITFTSTDVSAAAVNARAYEQDGSARQQWQFVLRDEEPLFIYYGGTEAAWAKKYSIINIATGQALTWSGNGWDSGVVQTADYDEENEKQIWRIADTLIAGGAGGISPTGGNLTVWPAEGYMLGTSGHVQPDWSFNTETMEITHLESGRMLHCMGSLWWQRGKIQYSTTEGTGDHRQWILEKTGEGSDERSIFRLKNKYSQTYMTWTGSSLVVADFGASGEQEFKIYYNEGYQGYIPADKTDGSINFTWRFDRINERIVKEWNYGQDDRHFTFNSGQGDYLDLEDGNAIPMKFGSYYVEVGKLENPNSGHSVSLSKDGQDYKINIFGWEVGYQYQIWTYEKVESDVFGSTGEYANQWLLQQTYTPGILFDKNDDGSIEAVIDEFVSPDKYYTVAVKILDNDGNFVGQIKDTYTPEQVGEVVIEKVEVDGVFADERTVVKNIDEETVNIEVFTNITDDVTYEATVNPGNIALTPDDNSFDWDISGLEPGRYTVTLKAQNSGTSDERAVRFNLYKVDPSITYGQMDTMTVTGGLDEGVFAIDIDPDIPSGNWVNYTISEPWRAAIYRSDAVSKEAAETGMVNTGISEGEYGIYQVATYVRRSISGSADDGMIRRVEYARDGAKSLDIVVDGDGYTSGTLTKDEGVQITITPDADLDLSQGEQMEYSYWRRDARGWVMIRDYSTTPGLTWTPARVGLYTIQVRAKGSDAGSYELIKNIEFNVTGADPLLTVDEITLSGTDNVDARVPVTITAGVVNPSSEDLLYKYIISNDYIYYVETAYSADPTYIWTPGKAGEYRISVLVKNQASFGKYDDVQTFQVTVD